MIAFKEHLSLLSPYFYVYFSLSPRGQNCDWNLRWQDKVSEGRRGSKWLESKNCREGGGGGGEKKKS